jgi:hypothetical protein
MVNSGLICESMAGMKVLVFAVATLAVAIQDVGCENKPAPAKPTHVTLPVHRFDREANMPPDVALDTITGQYCKTWDWYYKNPAAVGSADVQTLPTCLDLFNKYPSVYDLQPLPPPAPSN